MHAHHHIHFKQTIETSGGTPKIGYWLWSYPTRTGLVSAQSSTWILMVSEQKREKNLVSSYANVKCEHPQWRNNQLSLT